MAQMEGARLPVCIRIGVCAVVILAVASFGLAFFLPVYTDEIVWKMTQGRLGYDGFQTLLLTALPSCGDYGVSPPLALVPFRALDTALFEWVSNPMPIRLTGEIYLLLWLGITGYMLRRTFPRTISSWVIAGALLSFVTLGVMPFLLAISRPEQPLLIGATILLLLCVGSASPRPKPLAREIGAAIALVLVSGLILAAHPRAIFVLPLVVLAIIKTCRRRGLAVVATLAVGFLAFVVYGDWSARWACPADPIDRRMLEFANVGLAATAGDLGAFFSQLVDKLLFDPGHFFYLSQYGFYSDHTSGIVPPYPYRGIALILTLLIAALSAAFVSVGFFAFLTSLNRFRKDLRDPFVVLGIGFSWVFLGLALFSRIYKNDYEVELIEPLAMLVSVLSIWKAYSGIPNNSHRRPQIIKLSWIAFITLLATSAVSQFALLAGYAPLIGGPWTTPGYLANQKFSVPEFGYDRVRDEILATAQMCGIDPLRHPRHLVVDELTYFALRQSYQPFVMTYLVGAWGKDIPNLKTFLKEKGSAGVVVGCQAMPESLKDGAVQNGAFCCLPLGSG